jgi:hypothetical protein
MPSLLLFEWATFGIVGATYMSLSIIRSDASDLRGAWAVIGAYLPLIACFQCNRSCLQFDRASCLDHDRASRRIEPPKVHWNCRYGPCPITFVRHNHSLQRTKDVGRFAGKIEYWSFRLSMRWTDPRPLSSKPLGCQRGVAGQTFGNCSLAGQTSRSVTAALVHKHGFQVVWRVDRCLYQ